MAAKIKKIEKENKKPLINIYLKNDDSIEYEFVDEQTSIIAENNRMLHGTLALIQKQLLEIEGYGQESSEKESSDDEDDDDDSEDDDINLEDRDSEDDDEDDD